MSTKDDILQEMAFFRGNGEGIESWFSDNISDVAVDVLANCEKRPIGLEVLNQLLILSHEGGISEGFFRFYFLTNPHSQGGYWYNPEKLPGYDPVFLNSSTLQSLRHLKWGLSRLYIDGLLYFGNIRQCYRTLRGLKFEQLATFFRNKAFDPNARTGRNDHLPLTNIAKDDRYLIAETACKTYAPADESMPDLIEFIKGRYTEAVAAGKPRIKIKELIAPSENPSRYDSDQLSFSLDEALEREIQNSAELEAAIQPIIQKFKTARERALSNTKLYLSMISDMDVYVATSMRSRFDFRSMADFCETTFADPRIKDLKLRHFDPTMSAANNHEDKGLIECLMVKCAKILIYNAGARDSYGKDAEAAMALSLGKPVIFYCDTELKRKIFQEIHPLARLIDFENGVAVGSIVIDKLNDVPEMIRRIFKNDMEFELKKKSDNFFLLCEKLTGSVIRLQSSDLLLRETFWNYYHETRQLQQ
jgi:hypothetical protein